MAKGFNRDYAAMAKGRSPSPKVPFNVIASSLHMSDFHDDLQSHLQQQSVPAPIPLDLATVVATELCGLAPEVAKALDRSSPNGSNDDAAKDN